MSRVTAASDSIIQQLTTTSLLLLCIYTIAAVRTTDNPHAPLRLVSLDAKQYLSPPPSRNAFVRCRKPKPAPSVRGVASPSLVRDKEPPRTSREKSLAATGRSPTASNAIESANERCRRTICAAVRKSHATYYAMLLGVGLGRSGDEDVNVHPCTRCCKHSCGRWNSCLFDFCRLEICLGLVDG